MRSIDCIAKLDGWLLDWFESEVRMPKKHPRAPMFGTVYETDCLILHFIFNINPSPSHSWLFAAYNHWIANLNAMQPGRCASFPPWQILVMAHAAVPWKGRCAKKQRFATSSMWCWMSHASNDQLCWCYTIRQKHAWGVYRTACTSNFTLVFV